MNEKKPTNPWVKNLLIWVGILFGLVLFVQLIGGTSRTTSGGNAIAYSDFVRHVDQGDVRQVTMTNSTTGNPTISGRLNDGVEFHTLAPNDAQISDKLVQKGVDVQVKPEEGSSIWMLMLYNSLPLLLIIGISFFVMRQMQKNAGSGAMGFGKSRARMLTEKHGRVTFADVAGIDEAREELEEIVEYLKDPAKFARLGGKIPKGALLVGPPGTGKTLLARAIAGEAGVPFFTISGSDFVEMFVGVGASRVRDMFDQAKKSAPCIVFIDEIDAVGRHRGAGLGNGNDEREQTLNQLLVEMDGFDTNRGVILIAATNRPDILDPALLRPGRFDRQIVVDRPDLEGRKAILRVHSKGKPFAPDVDLDVIARRTPGFTGADLANVINEAALLTARTDAKQITTTMLEESIDRVIAGPMRKTRAMSDKEKKVTAYHEGGHALVAYALPHTDPVHKVTILPRGRSLGHTLVLPEEDKYTQTRSEMMDMLAYALGGRAAEELVFHEPTTGAANDIEKASQIARAMVMQYGMSNSLGAVRYGQGEGEVFLGRDMGHQRDYSEEIAGQIDDEIRTLIERAHDEAWEILVEHRDVLDDLVLRLFDKETVGKEELAEIFGSVPKRPARVFESARRRPKKEIPPVLTPNELALLGPQDVNGLRGRSNGSANGSNGSTRSRTTRAANGAAAKKTTPRRTTKRTSG